MKGWLVAILILILGIILIRIKTNTENKEKSPIIQIKQGKVQGIVSTSRDGRPFYEFLGIKYGISKRFKESIPAPNWENVYDASNYHEKCIQVSLIIGSIEGTEDCLGLNVFTPRLPGSNDVSKLPVLVLIHGGHFTEGSGNFRPEYFMDEEIVIVSMNYRLGALGFLNTNDGIVTGNLGLKDQMLALKWVQDNIHSFGGDKSRVTIQGESAGSVSVHLHVLSPMSSGLFAKAIAQSGVSVNPWALEKDPASQAKRFGKLLGCPTENMKAMVDCLSGKPAEEIVQIHKEILEPLRNPQAVFVPTVETFNKDSCFVCENPKTTMQKKDFKSVPIMVGINQDEGLIASVPLVRNDTLMKLEPENWYDWAPKFLYYGKDDKISDRIRKFYFKDADKLQNWNYLKTYTELFGDRHFFTGIQDTIKYHARNSKVYTYYYSYENELSLGNLLLAVKGEYPKLLEFLFHLLRNKIHKAVWGKAPEKVGICHSDELGLLFPLPLIVHVGQDDPDYNISKQLVKTFVQFCSKDTDLQFNSVKWEPIKDVNNIKYLKIDKSVEYVEHPFLERLKFWEAVSLKLQN